MINFFYRLLVDTRINTYDNYIKEAFDVIESYGLWADNRVENFIKDEAVAAEHLVLEDAFIKRPTKDGDGVVYDIFFENLHLHVSLRENEKIYSVRIKHQNDVWLCPVYEGEGGKRYVDASHPENNTYEVYVWYSVPVLDITHAVGYVYRHGTWDKYIYKSMNKFFDKIKEHTDDSKFNKDYK